MSRQNDLHELPPIALAEALDRPYQPGQTRRQILVGVAVVAALLIGFLAWMSRHGSARPRVDARQETAPGVVYQNLRVQPAPPPPPPHPAGGVAPEAAKAANNGDPR